MEQVLKNQTFKPANFGSLGFVFLFLLIGILAAAAIGSFPLQASIVTIFLFAGLHNFFEFRYFAARMPVYWGKSKRYYTVGILGVITLTCLYLTIYFSTGWLWNVETWGVYSAAWNTLFILWVGLLIYLRGIQRPNSDWSWGLAIAFFLVALTWLFPNYWALSLVYLHPFVAMYFLERQLRRSKREWLRAYHICLATIPFFIFTLYLIYGKAAPLDETTPLFSTITNHAGANILTGFSSRFLVATHVFIESIHYAVWILLIPLIDRRAIPWKLSEIPLYANRNGHPKLIAAVLLISFVLIFAFWIGFSFDYYTTRDVYFAFAIAHVTAEFPFLIKML